jgi:hypothetical protein
MEQQTFNPDIHLNAGEQAALTQTAGTPGYTILHRILRAEVDRFVLNLINADAADEKDVYAKHLLAKSAAQFYQGVTERINEEVLQYTSAHRRVGKPQDVTESLLDIGEPASEQEDLENDEFLGEGIFDEQ